MAEDQGIGIGYGDVLAARFQRHHQFDFIMIVFCLTGDSEWRRRPGTSMSGCLEKKQRGFALVIAQFRGHGRDNCAPRTIPAAPEKRARLPTTPIEGLAQGKKQKSLILRLRIGGNSEITAFTAAATIRPARLRHWPERDRSRCAHRENGGR